VGVIWMLELVLGIVSGFALGFSLMAFRLCQVEKYYVKAFEGLLKILQDVRP
jgi:hypothetical protein